MKYLLFILLLPCFVQGQVHTVDSAYTVKTFEWKYFYPLDIVKVVEPWPPVNTFQIDKYGRYLSKRFNNRDKRGVFESVIFDKDKERPILRISTYMDTATFDIDNLGEFLFGVEILQIGGEYYQRLPKIYKGYWESYEEEFPFILDKPKKHKIKRGQKLVNPPKGKQKR